jgi:hypothetical protein
MFASFKQLDQVAKLFLDAWAISKVHGQSKIYCAHGVSHGKSPKLHSIVTMLQNILLTEKEKSITGAPNVSNNGPFTMVLPPT